MQNTSSISNIIVIVISRHKLNKYIKKDNQKTKKNNQDQKEEKDNEEEEEEEEIKQTLRTRLKRQTRYILGETQNFKEH